MEPIKDETMLARWLSNDLTPEEKREIEGHPDFTAWNKIIQTADILHIPEFDTTKGWSELNKLRQKQPARTARIRSLYWVAAAAIAITVGIFFLLPASQSVQTRIGETQSLTLPDGSTTTLNAVSTISYNANSWHKKRRVNLTGEAQFVVESDPRIPFIVEAGPGQIQVLGTIFNVRNRTDQFEVYCLEGRVTVRTDNATVDISANQTATLIDGQLKVILDDVNAPSWTTGRTNFQDTPLSLVIAEMERLYPVSVQMDDIMNRSYTGPLFHDNLEQAVSTICGGLELLCTVSADQKMVNIREKD